MSSRYNSMRAFALLSLTAALASLLAGCFSPAATPAPTLDVQPTLIAVQTQSARTVIAALTQNAPTATPVPPASPTPLPSATPTVTPVPSNTPLPSPTPTNTFVPFTRTPTATLSPFRCTVTDVSPKTTTSLIPGGDFDGTWVIKNTGDETWYAKDVDLVYSAGTKFQQNANSMDLKNNVAPGESYTAVVDMLAPKEPGTYSTTWVLTNGAQNICVMALTINVK